MSILAQILKDMYIDPELLAELSDEQKQLLLCKMREEQVRRWEEFEKKFDEADGKKRKKTQKCTNKPNKKMVGFLSGSDGNDWVWVMGEHKSDKSIEQILEEEAQTAAHIQAEKEAEKCREEEEECLAREQLEEQQSFEEDAIKKEAELQAIAEEAALYQSLKEAQIAAEQMVVERRRSDERVKLRKEQSRQKYETEKRRTLLRVESQREKRSSEIYTTWRKSRRALEIVAEQASKQADQDWKNQEKKAKEADRQMRDIARKAREEHKRALKTTSKFINAVNAFSRLSTNDKPAPPLPHKSNKDAEEPVVKSNRSRLKTSARPPNRSAVIQWFKEDEIPKATEIDPLTGKPAIWFHGLINRQKAESMLENKQVGSYLVRVSERIWGYAITYRATERCKHFLVEAIDTGYQFLGSNANTYNTLIDLIDYHKNNVISSGLELLLYPCGQETDPPDYSELFHAGCSESTAL